MNDNLHNELLDNPNAEFQNKIQAFQDYLELKYKSDEALKMAGLNIEDIENDPFLRLYYLTAKKKEN